MIKDRSDCLKKCEEYEIPEHMYMAVERYLFDGIQPGDFLTSILENKLFESYYTADHMNKNSIEDWVSLIYNEFPATAWGSPSCVAEWLVRGHRRIYGILRDLDSVVEERI